MSFPRGTVVKNPPADAGDVRDVGLIPGLGRSPGGGHGSPCQYSCLENPMDRGAQWALVHRVAKGWDTTEATLHSGIHLKCTARSWNRCAPCYESSSVVSNSLWPHELYSPWNSLGQNSGVGSFPSPGELPGPGIEPRSLASQADSLPSEPQGKPLV